MIQHKRKTKQTWYNTSLKQQAWYNTSVKQYKHDTTQA